METDENFEASTDLSWHHLADRASSTSPGNFQLIVPDEDRCRSRSRGRRNSRTVCDNLEMIASAKLHESVTKETVIAAMPNCGCFAVKTNDSLTLLSPGGGVIETFAIETSKVAHFSDCSVPSCLAVNSANGQLICVDRGQIKTIKPVNFPSKNACLTAKRIDKIAIAPRGIAVSVSTCQLFTCNERYLVGYSLKNWDETIRLRIQSPQIRLGACVLGVRNKDNALFFRGNNGTKLYSAPIYESSGKTADLFDIKSIETNFDSLQSVTFNDRGEIFTADRDRLLVLSEDGEEIIGCARFANNSRRFFPTSIALLNVRDVDELWRSANSQIQYSCIVATPDFSANRIVFFGCSDDF